jgi:hypothetical protein
MQYIAEELHITKSRTQPDGGSPGIGGKYRYQIPATMDG